MYANPLNHPPQRVLAYLTRGSATTLVVDGWIDDRPGRIEFLRKAEPEPPVLGLPLTVEEQVALVDLDVTQVDTLLDAGVDTVRVIAGIGGRREIVAAGSVLHRTGRSGTCRTSQVVASTGGGGAGLRGPEGPPGPKGDQGPTGPVGPRGNTGPTGARGEQGPTGPQGEQGLTGPKGQRGATGARGATGPQGPQGPAGPAPAETSYQPVLYAPVRLTIGNGTLEGGYRLIGNRCEFWIHLVRGSRTDAGAGAYQFTLPVKPERYRRVTGTGWTSRGNTPLIVYGASYETTDKPATVGVLISSSGKQVDQNNPAGWATGDELYIAGSYVVA